MAFEKGHTKKGGRTKGALNKKTVETIQKAEESGLMPLDYMLTLLRDESQASIVRFEAAKAAAPYLHSKAPIESKSTIDVRGAPYGMPITPAEVETINKKLDESC